MSEHRVHCILDANVIFDLHAGDILEYPCSEEQASFLKQIAEAEDLKKMHYFISVPTAYYEIEYGLVKGGGKGG